MPVVLFFCAITDTLDEMSEEKHSDLRQTHNAFMELALLT